MFIAILYKEDDGFVVTQKIIDAHSREETARIVREEWNEKKILQSGQGIMIVSED
jgi:RNase P protein component